MDRVRAAKEEDKLPPLTAALGSAAVRASSRCELYANELAPAGVPLDAQLAEELMKAAVQAGRGELAQNLFEKAPGGDASKYVAEIKLFSRKRDLGGARRVFDR